MREDAILPCEHVLSCVDGRLVVNVAIDCCRALQIIDLRDTLYSVETLGESFSVADSWREIVGFMGDDIVSDAVTVIDCGDGGGFGTPRVR